MLLGNVTSQAGQLVSSFTLWVNADLELPVRVTFGVVHPGSSLREVELNRTSFLHLEGGMRAIRTTHLL